MRIRWWRAAAVVCLFALMTGCGQILAEARNAKPAVVQVAAFAGPESSVLEELAPLYEKQTGVKIRFVKFSYDALYTKELQSIYGKNGIYDVIFMDDPWVPTFAGGGYLHNLSDFGYRPEGFVKGALQVVQWPPPKGYPVPKGAQMKPGIYGLPVTGNVTMFVYRKDWAKKYGIQPERWTWDDVFRLAEKTTGGGTYGWVMRSGSGNSAVTDFYPMLLAYGGKYFNDDWTCALDSPEALRALTQWVKLFRTYAPPGSASFGSDAVGNYMAKGKAAAAIMWPSGWANQMDRSKIGFVTVPGVKQPDGSVLQAPEVGVWSVGIPKNAPHAQEASRFIRWLADKQQQKRYGSSGVAVPTRTDVLLDPQLLKKWPYYAAFYDSLEKGRMRPRTPAWPMVEQIFGNEVVRAELGEITPRQALRNACEQIDHYMRLHGYVKK